MCQGGIRVSVLQLRGGKEPEAVALSAVIAVSPEYPDSPAQRAQGVLGVPEFQFDLRKIDCHARLPEPIVQLREQRSAALERCLCLREVATA